MGVSNREMDIIANVARYHSEESPSSEHNNYDKLYYKDKLRVAKLSAILKLAEALDISHKQKINKFEVSISGKEIFFKFKATQDTLLEEWNFTKHALFFEEVMGYRPVIKRRG